MKIDSALLAALGGVQKGLLAIRRDAVEIASADRINNDGNLIEPLPRLMMDKIYLQANAKTFEIVGDLIGTLIDVKA